MMREREESLNRLSQASGTSKVSKKRDESTKKHDYYQDKNGFLSPNLNDERDFRSPFSDKRGMTSNKLMKNVSLFEN